MEVKYCVFIALLLIATTTARPKKIIRQPWPIPQMPPCIPRMATLRLPVIETIDYACSCQTRRCNDQLILPPMAPELPCGLGYLPGALPLVADYFEPEIEYMTTGAYLPVSRGCDCLTLAAPVCPDYAALVRPIIL